MLVSRDSSKFFQLPNHELGNCLLQIALACKIIKALQAPYVLFNLGSSVYCAGSLYTGLYSVSIKGRTIFKGLKISVSEEGRFDGRQ